jgi:hypothetical protein
MFEVGGLRPDARAVTTTCLGDALINTHAVEWHAAVAACARK